MLVEFTFLGISDLTKCLINVMNVIESKLFVLLSNLLPREMLFRESEVLLNGWKFEARIKFRGGLLYKLALNSHKQHNNL